MTTWGEIKTEIPKWVAMLARQPAGAVAWLDGPRPIAEPIVLVNVSSFQDRITHEKKEIDDKGLCNVLVSVDRTMTLQVRVECAMSNGRSDALRTADDARLRSMMTHHQNALIKACGVWPSKMPSECIPLIYTWERSKIQVRSFDLFLVASFQSLDTDPTYQTFNKVGLAGSYSDGPNTFEIPAYEVQKS